MPTFAEAWGCAVRWRVRNLGVTRRRDSDRPAEPGHRPARFLRELAAAPSIAVIVLSVLLGLPATILLTPDQHTTIAGQDLAVGARLPSLSWSGPAQLVQIGNTRLDVAPLDIVGPLRPRITLGPVARNAAAEAALDPSQGSDPRGAATGQLTGAFIRWYLWAGLLLLAIVGALVALAACLRVLLGLRRESRRQIETQTPVEDQRATARPNSLRWRRRRGEPDVREPLTVAQLWQRSRIQVWAMGVAAMVAALIAWAGCGALAYNGVVDGLAQVRSLSDLVGNYYVAPSAVGPVVNGFTGAVIGDSRAARLGGPAAQGASEEDLACARSSDSLAAEISALTSLSVDNLACSGASISAGVRGAQAVPSGNGTITVAAQVGRLRQLAGLKFVVVVIGPNDLGWVDQVRYCYGATDCTDRLTEGEFNYRLAAFDRAYGDLLHDLVDLPGAPQVVIMTSYDIFAHGANCADTQGPAGTPGLSPQNIDLLADRNHQLNNVLTTGAQKYGFDVATPVVTPLCAKASDSLGPDLQGLADEAPFHPTAVGMLRLASAVVRVLHPGG